jgi:exonuclease III
MKITTWNCNMAFREKYQHVTKDKPEILVIQECENRLLEAKYKDEIGYTDIIWHGENPNKGVAVISFNGIKLKLLDKKPTCKYVIPVKAIINKIEIPILAVWTKIIDGDKYSSYIVQAVRAANKYSELLNDPNVIMIGDFNSSVLWDNEFKRESNHTDLIQLLVKYNIESAYHSINREKQGEESTQTLYFRKDLSSGHHIDYVFVKEKNISSRSTIMVGNPEKHLRFSDHMPIFLDGLDFAS